MGEEKRKRRGRGQRDGGGGGEREKQSPKGKKFTTYNTSQSYYWQTEASQPSYPWRACAARVMVCVCVCVCVDDYSSATG